MGKALVNGVCGNARWDANAECLWSFFNTLPDDEFAAVGFILLYNLLDNDVRSSARKQWCHGFYFRYMVSSLVKGEKIKSIQGLFWDWLNTAQTTCPSGARKQTVKAAEEI